MNDEVTNIMCRAEAGHMYPLDQLVLWETLKGLAKTYTPHEMQPNMFIYRHILNGLEVVKQRRKDANH
jgi:hypothetical protein